MADDFPKLVKGFIFIVLFSFLLVGFVTQFAGNYNKDSSEITDRIGMQELNDTLAGQKDIADNWQKRFQEQNVFLAFGGIVLTGIFQLANTIGLAITLPFKIFGNILVGILGVPVIVVNIISVMIVLTLILGIWRLVKVGG